MALWGRLGALRTGFCILSFFSVPLALKAQDVNDNVVIEDATEDVRFVRVKGEDGSVKVEQTSRTTYLCKDYRVSIPIVESYFGENTIDEVRVYSDGRRNKAIQPNFDYHEQEDIFYSDSKLCYFMLPLEKKGAKAEVVFERTISKPIYFMGVYFADDREIVQKTIRINVPEWMSVELKEMNFEGWKIESSKEQKDDATVYTYVIRNARALKREPAAPGQSHFAPHVMVLPKESRLNGVQKTYFKTVGDQYKWYRGLVTMIGNDETVVKQKALEITAGKTSDEDKVKAIYYWVQQNIRYIAYEDGIAGLQPKKAQEVLSKKYGDCKGMGNLLVVMLRAIGYDARLCWLGTNHVAYDYSTPALCVDNHMIAAWMRNGKPMYLDGTEKFIRFGETAERIQGRQILIENGDNYLLERVPVAHHDQNTSIEERILHVEGQDLKGR
jgi:transglutaminase-like putative cysteine protease